MITRESDELNETTKYKLYPGTQRWQSAVRGILCPQKVRVVSETDYRDDHLIWRCT